MPISISSAPMRSIVGFTMIVFATSVGQSGDMWSHGDRLGRYLGCGFGDGYHACRTDRRTPLADLPIHRPTEASCDGSCQHSCGASGGMGGMIVECNQPLLGWSLGRGDCDACDGSGACDDAACDSLPCDEYLPTAPRVSIDLYPARTVVVPERCGGSSGPIGCDAACDGMGQYTSFETFMRSVEGANMAAPSVPVPPAMMGTAMAETFQGSGRTAATMVRPYAGGAAAMQSDQSNRRTEPIAIKPRRPRRM